MTHTTSSASRGASFDEIKAAYRRACKSKHPDMGGSHEEFVELQKAYEFVLEELKRGYRQREEARRAERRPGSADARTDRGFEKAYRDIDDELEELRRAAQAHEEALRAMRARAWEAGDRATWAKLTWSDLVRFIRTIARSGIKGIALLIAALTGVGSVLVEANVVSALILLGSGIGFFLSLALKNDKGGVMSAGLLLFGLMTIWLPPVRAALFAYPLATISVLLCLGLIFKFAQAGGTVGFLTGGVLALYVIVVIVGDAERGPQSTALDRPSPQAPRSPDQAKTEPETPSVNEARKPSPTPVPSVPPIRARPDPKPMQPEPRTLIASKGAMLKFVAGVTYHLKIRSGFTTTLIATEGSAALFSGDARLSECSRKLEFSAPSSKTPYDQADGTIRSCDGDAIFRVDDVT